MRKSLLLVPYLYKLKESDSIMNFVAYYQASLDVFILVNDIEEEVIVKTGYKIVNVNKSSGKFLCLMADYVIDAGGLTNEFKKNKQAKWYAIGSGIPYQKILLNDNNNNNKTLETTISYSMAYNAMISSSNYYSETFLKTVIGYPGPIYQLGCSKIDSLIRNNNLEYVAEIKEKLKIPKNKAIILYCPVITGSKTNFCAFITKFMKEISDEYYLLVRLKAQDKPLNIDSNKIKNVSNYENDSDLLLCSDVLITDYSSSLFDFSILKKPIILFQTEKKATYFNLEQYLQPAAIINDVTSLINLFNFKKYQNLSDDIANTFYPMEDGNSTKRIVNQLNLDVSERFFSDIIFIVNDLHDNSTSHTYIKKTAEYYTKKYNSRVFVISINEFPIESNSVHLLDSKFITTTLSMERNSKVIPTILRNTEGIIISLDLLAHKKMQKYLDNKNVIIMIKQNINDDAKLLMELTKEKIINYKKIIISTGFEANLPNKIKERLEVEDLFKASEELIKEIFDHLVSLESISASQVKKTKHILIAKAKKYVRKIKKDVKKFAKKMGVDYRNVRNLSNLKIQTKKINKGISIITPTYNSSLTLEQTIRSVIAQKLSNYEMIIVDDGSNEEEIIKIRALINKFQAKQINIVLYEKENSGPGLTRNYGIQQATKDYVFFLDSDDTLPKNALRFLLGYALRHDLEVVSGKTIRIDVQADQVMSGWQAKIYKKNRIFKNDNTRYFIYSDTLTTNKLYQRAVFEKYDLWFDNILYEDKLFTSKLYVRIEKLGIIKKDVYNWLVYGRETSITTNRSLYDFQARMQAIEKSWENYPEIIRYYMFAFFFSHDLMIYLREFNNYSKQEKEIILASAKEFVKKNSHYYDDNLQKNDLSRYLFLCLYHDDFESISELGTKLSTESLLMEKNLI